MKDFRFPMLEEYTYFWMFCVPSMRSRSSIRKENLQ